jgi:non-specific serine/threonine protein kinase/serine/threonine-protein kinase
MDKRGRSDKTETLQSAGGTARTIGVYHLLQQIGEGGMGEVWVAEQHKPIHRRVALKLIKAGLDTSQVIARFESERQALAMMNHPAIARVFEAGQTDEGRPYFVMEYVQGVPITEHCDRNRLTTQERLGLFKQICDGVQHAHQRAIIHRDLKPSNILVAIQDGVAVPKIIDFGVAKATARSLTARTMYTELGAFIGTPEYMSPEQAEMSGQNVDTRTDVYSLGVILYELLVGALPFDPQELRTAGFDEIRRKIREEDPPRPSTKLSTMGDVSTAQAQNRRIERNALIRQIQGDLDWITMKALDKDRTRRYGSPSDLAADIDRFLRHQPVAARPPSAVYKARKFIRRHRVGVGVATTLAVLLVAFSVTTAIQARRIARERDKARLATQKAEQINAFVVGMLGSADPRTSGREVTVASVLDAASARVESELAGQPEVKAAVLTTLGTTYEGLGLYAPARQTLQAALEASIAAYGQQHIEVARALDRLAGAAASEGNLQEAERRGREALAMLDRLGKADGAEAAQVKGDLAVVLNGLGKSNEAEALYRAVLAIRRRVDGNRSEAVAATLNNLGVLLGQRGDWAGAEPLHREALEIVSDVRGPEHPAVAAAINSLGAVLEEKGDLPGAEALYRDSLALRLKRLGSNHPDVARSRYALAHLLREKGDAEGALQECRQVLALRGSFLADAHPMVAATQQVMGLALLDLGRPGEAERVLIDSLELRRKALPPDHWLIASSESVLGACLAAESRYPEAEALLIHAHAGLESSRGPDHARTVETRQRLVALYEAWGQPDRAAAWRRPAR